MRGKFLGIILILLLSISESFSSNDTIHFSQDFSIFTPQKINAVEFDNPSIQEYSSFEFKQIENGFRLKSGVLVEQFVHYSGEAPINIIVETGGFHFVDVHLINLATRDHILKKTGRLVPYPENELFETYGKSNKVLLTLVPNSTYKILVYYHNPMREFIDVQLSYSEEHKWIDAQGIRKSKISFWLGLFFGTLILLSLINFIFYYLFKDGTYIVYVGYIITIAIYESMLYGFLDQSWFKYYPKGLFILNNTSLFLFITFYLLFLQFFLNLKDTYPRWNKALKLIVVYLAVMAIVSDIILFTGYLRVGFNVRNFSLLLIIPVAVTFLINVLFSKRLIDRVFFTGSFFLVFSGLASIVSFFDPSLGNSDVYLQVGIIIELVIFNIGLGLRSKMIQNEKDLELQALNASLEEKVKERTQEINKINEELTSQRDQLYKQNERVY